MELIARAIRRFRSDGPVHGAAVVRDALFKGSRSAAAQRWIDRHLATIPSDADFFRALGRPVPSTAADLRRAVADLDATLRRRYLPSLSDPATARAIAEHRPDCAAATLRRAEDILAGRFSWLISGYPDGALRWHALIDSPADWPLEPASALDIDSARRPGDVRRIWELSRHQWLGTLARAHLVTGEGRYAEAIGDTLADWIAHNPFGVGVHWLHAQEAALRIRSWLLALAATSRSDAIPPERRLLIYKLLWLHGEYVVRTLSSGATTHNHLITEVAGLLALGVAVPGLRPLRRAALRASATLHAEVLKQFWEEGSPGEGATSYHLFVLESVVEALALRRHAVLPLDDGVRARVLAMLDFARRVVRPDGSVPLIGDADGGRGFRLTDLDDGRDRRGVLAVGALLLGRGDMACGLSQMPEEPAWLLGPAAFDAWRRLRRDEPGQRARLFQCGGFAVLRQDVGVSRSHVVMTAGPTARRIGVSQSHQHCHGLSLTWWLDGEELLVDPGVWLYAGEDRLRAAFRGADAHSGLQLDDRDPFDVTTWRFGVDGQQTADVVEWEGAEDHHRVAFRVPAGPDRSATLERQLLWRPDPGWILLSDAWSGAGVHRTRQWLQVGAVEARTVEGGLALLRDGRLLAHAWWSSELRAELRRGDSPEPGLGLFAPRYGERRDGTTIGLWRDEPLPARRPLLLAPATCGRPVWEEGRLRIPVPGGVDVVRIEAGRAVAVERE
ncbi:MAG: hypothetical protein AMXMBFR64_32940 [Myxococcales bacterium]